MDAAGATCRLCDENKQKMYSIFTKNQQGLQILHLIKECLPVVIYRTDPLSKQICYECYNNLEIFYKFKKTSLATATKHRKHLLNNENYDKSVQLFLSCEDEELNGVDDIPKQISVSTSTDDLQIACINCKSNFDLNINSEVELCAELHKAIADSLHNKDVEKIGRARRRRSQAFYHELDDSLCSSLTELTNTESSQCFEEYHSDVESYDTDSEDTQRAKRRKLDNSVLTKPEDLQFLKDLYSDEVEYRYFPLNLMNLALNVINKTIVPNYEPDEFYVKLVEPACTYCRETFKNSKLLALHEIEHINIELGEKVDHPSLWHESRDDAVVRNKWLNSYDDYYDDDEYTEECEPPQNDLLIPIGTESPEQKVVGEIILVGGKPTANGRPLTDYSKEERKAFYQSMKIGNNNRKFCTLCRYSFKDNWAIESHYFSLACYYTCRYCGMRFNKQRHRFDDHVREHEDRGDPLSTKIYEACRLNNFVPRIIPPEKVKKVEATSKAPLIRVRNFQKKPLPNITIKEEKIDSDDEKAAKVSQTKTTNQAYFCRKCYKVFFKLDEFNMHSKNCDYNQFPQNRNNLNRVPPKPNSNGEVSTARPVRHCVKESTYKDEALVSEPPKDSTNQTFVCYICNTPFPTIYSRNSHMRIHKSETNNKLPIMPAKRPDKVQNFATFIKQEPLEPEVQIHESEQNYNSHNSIGTVSITPISKNPNQKATINPNIMKLVQNNPHLTIKANRSPDRQQPMPSVSSNQQNLADSDKTYKCSSCWEAFTNKSHLYFHKKNQCEGSKYPCPFCKKRFGTEAAYSSHIFYSHPE